MGRPENELRADVFALVADARHGKYKNESASDVTDRILAAFARWNRRAAPPAAPPKPLANERLCPSRWMDSGGVVHGCVNCRAATPGTAPAPPGEPAAMPSLINQLMMGADAWMQLASQLLPGLTPAQGQVVYEERSLRARQYRERAERIRYWIARAKAFRDNPNVPLDDMSGPMVVSMLEIICGEVPAPPPGDRGGEG